MLKINGQEIHDPSEFSWERQPQSSFAERNANGLLNRETLPDKQVLKCTWLFWDKDEFADLVYLLSSLTREFIQVTFPHPVGEDRTIEAYIAPISAKMLDCHRRYGARWSELKCNFIER